MYSEQVSRKPKDEKGKKESLKRERKTEAKENALGRKFVLVYNGRKGGAF